MAKKILITDEIRSLDSQYMEEQALAPATPPSGQVVVYAKTDGKVYSKDDAGVETELGGSAGAGANQTLSNLTSPTAINQDLIFDKANAVLQTQDETGATVSENLSIETGTSVNAQSGSINMYSGNTSGTGSSGAIGMGSGENSATSTGQTGDVIFSTGTNNSNVDTTQSGNFQINTGGSASSTAAVNSGYVQVYTGDVASDNISASTGSVNIITGTLTNGAASGSSGTIALQTGSVPGSANSGGVSINTGSANTGSSGNISLQTGTAGGVRGSLIVSVGDIDMANSTSMTIPTAATPFNSTLSNAVSRQDMENRAGVWKVYQVQGTAFSAAATTETINLVTLPVFGFVNKIVVTNDSAWTGTGLSALSLSVGDYDGTTYINDHYMAGYDLFATPTQPQANVIDHSNFPPGNISATHYITLTLNSVGANLADVDGSFMVFVNVTPLLSIGTDVVL